VRDDVPLVTFVEWPGMYHEMFNEVGKMKVLERVAEWIESVIARTLGVIKQGQAGTKT
jgi:alpha-beta hydrolase superfamily lysophospholipase